MTRVAIGIWRIKTFLFISKLPEMFTAHFRTCRNFYKTALVSWLLRNIKCTNAHMTNICINIMSNPFALRHYFFSINNKLASFYRLKPKASRRIVSSWPPSRSMDNKIYFYFTETFPKRSRLSIVSGHNTYVPDMYDLLCFIHDLVWETMCCKYCLTNLNYLYFPNSTNQLTQFLATL